jgi:hypothetical protein
MLLGFVDAREFDGLPDDERRRRAWPGSPRCSATPPSKPVDYLDFRWGRAVRPGRSDRGRSAGIVDNRDLRRVDRFPRRRGALGAAGGGRSPTGSSKSAKS